MNSRRAELPADSQVAVLVAGVTIVWFGSVSTILAADAGSYLVIALGLVEIAVATFVKTHRSSRVLRLLVMGFGALSIATGSFYLVAGVSG